MSKIFDPGLAPEGHKRIEWVKSYMPLLRTLEAQLKETRPLKGVDVALSIHLEAKSAYLCKVLQAAGANLYVTGCNVLSTRDEIAAALVEEGMEVFAIHGASPPEYIQELKSVLACKPRLILDDGGDFVQLLHEDCKDDAVNLVGGCEETTTGIHRLRARAKAGNLRFPMMAVNDAQCKHLFDNRYGTGQSAWDGIMRATNLTVCGKTVVVAGYGWCGKGVAAKAKGLGANVIVTEIDPVAALEAMMDGFRVMTMQQAALLGDIFITVTGSRDVLRACHFEVMREGAVLANAGHFDVEISLGDLDALATRSFERKQNVRGYRMQDGRVLNLLAEGRLVNLASGDGHPAEIMDMSFAVQTLSLIYLHQSGGSLAPDLYVVPEEIDTLVATLKLAAEGIQIDTPTEAQVAYLKGWE